LAIEQIYEEKEETIRNIAIANRVARYADDNFFKEFVKVKDEINLDETDNFSI
jgi:hypothetical protein